MKEHEAGAGWGEEGGDVGGCELVGSFEIPIFIQWLAMNCHDHFRSFVFRHFRYGGKTDDGTWAWSTHI